MPEALSAAIITGCIAIIGAVVSLVTSKLEAKKTKTEIEDIKKTLEDSGGTFYVVCPNCGTKIYLRGVEIKKETKKE